MGASGVAVMVGDVVVVTGGVVGGLGSSLSSFTFSASFSRFSGGDCEGVVALASSSASQLNSSSSLAATAITIINNSEKDTKTYYSR